MKVSGPCRSVMDAVATVPCTSTASIRRERLGSSGAGRPVKRAQYSSRHHETNALSRSPSRRHHGPLVDSPSRGIYTITRRRDPQPSTVPLLDQLAVAFTTGSGA